MGLRHQSRLGLGNPRVGQIAARALINGVVDRADERIRHIPRIPAQRRPVRFDKGRVRSEGRKGKAFRLLQDDAGRRRLAYAGRSVQQKMLRVHGSQLALHRFYGSLLADDGTELFRTDLLHNRLRQLYRIELLQLGQLALRLWGLHIAQFFLDNLHLDFLHVFLLLFFHPLGNFLFQPLFYSLAGQHFSQHDFQLVQYVDDLVVLRNTVVRRVFIYEALQADQPLPRVFRMDIGQGGVFTGSEHHLFRPYKTSKSAVKHVNLTAELFLRRRFQILMAL